MKNKTGYRQLSEGERLKYKFLFKRTKWRRRLVDLMGYNITSSNLNAKLFGVTGVDSNESKALETVYKEYTEENDIN